MLTFAAANMSFTDWDISGPMPSPSIRVTMYLPYRSCHISDRSLQQVEATLGSTGCRDKDSEAEIRKQRFGSRDSEAEIRKQRFGSRDSEADVRSSLFGP